MKKRKHRVSPYASEVSLTPVVDEPRPSLKKFQAEEAAKEKAAQDVTARANQQRLDAEQEKANNTIRELVALRASTVFTLPLSDDVISQFPKSDVTAKTADEYSQQMLAAIRSGLPNTTLTVSGKAKLMSVAGLNRMILNLTDPRVWRILYDYMAGLRVFTEADGVPQPVNEPTPIAPEPIAKPTIDNLHLEHREERLEALRITGLNWSSDVLDFYMQWADSMRKHWNVNVVSEDIARRVGEYMTRWNLSPLRHESFNQVRRAFSKLGVFKSSDGQVLDLRLPEEILADRIEVSDLSSRDVRRAIGLQTREFQNQ